MRPIDPVLLVGVDLPGLGFPPHSSGWISVEEQPSVESYAAGNLKWSAVEDEQIELGRQVQFEGSGDRSAKYAAMSMSESGRAVPAAWLP